MKPIKVGLLGLGVVGGGVWDVLRRNGEKSRAGQGAALKWRRLPCAMWPRPVPGSMVT